MRRFKNKTLPRQSAYTMRPQINDYYFIDDIMNDLYHIETLNMNKICYRINVYKFSEKFSRYKFETSIDFYKDKKDDQFIARDAHIDTSVFKYLQENNICDHTIPYLFACCYHTKCTGGDLKLSTSFLLQII